MTLKLSHQFIKSPVPGSNYKSGFSIVGPDGTIGQMMTEKQARLVFECLHIDFPEKSTLSQWTVEID